jgi:hypothetical protein
MSSTTAPKFPRPEFKLQMASNEEDAETVIHYRGYDFTVEFIQDEDLYSPGGSDHEIPLSDAQEAAFDRKEWWYHHLVIQCVGDELVNIVPAKLRCVGYPGRMASFEDHTELVFEVCDKIADQMQDFYDRRYGGIQ